MKPRSVGGAPSACSDSPNATHSGALSMTVEHVPSARHGPKPQGTGRPTSSLPCPWEAHSLQKETDKWKTSE